MKQDQLPFSLSKSLGEDFLIRAFPSSDSSDSIDDEFSLVTSLLCDSELDEWVFRLLLRFSFISFLFSISLISVSLIDSLSFSAQLLALDSEPSENPAISNRPANLSQSKSFSLSCLWISFFNVRSSSSADFISFGLSTSSSRFSVDFFSFSVGSSFSVGVTIKLLLFGW